MGTKKAPAKNQPVAKAGKTKGPVDSITSRTATSPAPDPNQVEPPALAAPDRGGSRPERLYSRIVRFTAVHVDQIITGVVASVLATVLIGGGALLIVVHTQSANSATLAPRTQQVPAPTTTVTSSQVLTPAATELAEPTFARMTRDSPQAPTLADVQWLGPCAGDAQVGCEQVRVTWEEFDPAGVTVRVYALTRCLHPGAACVTDSDLTDPSDLKFIREVPAGQGSAAFPMRHETSLYLLNSCLDSSGLSVYAYLVQAVNVHGGSRLPIAITIIQPGPEPSGTSL